MEGQSSKLEELDLEQWSHENVDKRAPRCRRYRIRVDKQHFVVQDSAKYGREILALVGYTPDKWNLDQKFRGGRREAIAPDQLVDFRTPGIERFETSPKQVQAGSPSRRDLSLPADDTEFLDATFDAWDSISDGRGQGVIVHSYSLPRGFTQASVDLLIQIPPRYPATTLDMFYLSPAVARTDGRPIGQLSNHTFAGRCWQRWSRHRIQGQQWRPGIDNLSTHFSLVWSALVAETAKAA